MIPDIKLFSDADCQIIWPKARRAVTDCEYICLSGFASERKFWHSDKHALELLATRRVLNDRLGNGPTQNVTAGTWHFPHSARSYNSFMS